MSGRGVRLSARHERYMYPILLFAYATGIAWMVLHYGINRDAGLEDAWRVAEAWMLRVHGAAAMATLIAFGSVLPVHVPTAWHLRRNRRSGIGMLAMAILLAATGWLLYYASAETARAWSSTLHMGIGGASPLALIWHLARRKWFARAAREAAVER